MSFHKSPDVVALCEMTLIAIYSVYLFYLYQPGLLIPTRPEFGWQICLALYQSPISLLLFTDPVLVIGQIGEIHKTS